MQKQLRLLPVLVYFAASSISMYAQTPGMIFENLGIGVLDPNLDGFISKTTLGFSATDMFTSRESEIPYVPFAVVQVEPTYDPGPGPNCFFNDFDDIRQYGEPMYVYYDPNTAGGPYLLYRFRLSGYSPNSKSYSVFIDIDGKFGDPAVVGASAGDPNYTSFNPGFEVEIYLATNFGVGIYNIDGVHSGTSTDAANVNAMDGTFPYTSHAQKALAWIYPGGSCTDGQEYFYDFFIPWSAVEALTFSSQTATNIGGSHITSATPLRMVGATIMNPNPGFTNGIDNASLSDWGGIDDEGTPEDLVKKLIDVFPPTTVEDIDGDTRIAPRSDCPYINTPIFGSTAISGTSTEDDGTVITVYVSANPYFSGALTYITTVSSGEWTVTVPALVEGDYVKATAQNPNESYDGVMISESVSYDNCDIEVVIQSCDDNKTPGVYNTAEIGGRKGFSGNIDNPLGHTMEVAIYGLDGTLFDLGASPLHPNPCITTTTDWIIQAATSGGSFTPGIYYIVSRDLTANICPSDYEYICMSNNSGDYKNQASVPVINGVSPLSASLTSLTGTTSGESSAIVKVYIDGVVSDATVTGKDWELTGLSFEGCESIEVLQYITQAGIAECVSDKATASIGSKIASKPVVSGSYCAGSGVAITGTSAEPDGSVIDIYEDAVLLGTANVNNNVWRLFGQTVTDGSSLTARIPASTCLSASSYSDAVVVGSKTTNTGISIDNSVAEGATSVQVTAPSSGGPYTLKLYVDYYNEAGWTSPLLSIPAEGTYTFTGLTDAFGNSLIYPGTRLTATAEDGANCESEQSVEYEVPCDVSIIESVKTVTAESPVCSGTRSVITIENSQPGIMYQVYDAGNNPVGYTAAGSGSDIYISTGSLVYGGVSPATDPQNFTVKAIRMVPTTSQCIATLNGGTPVTVSVKEDIGPIDLTVGVSPEPATICSGGTVDVTVSSTQNAVFYQLYDNNTDESLSSTVAGNGGDITITSGVINGSGNVPVRVTAFSGTCSADLSTIVGVQLKDSPSITGDLTVCEGSTGEVYTTESSMTNYSWNVTGGTITGGQNTESITVTWDVAGSQTITVNYDESYCGTTYDVDVLSCGAPGITTTLSGGSNQTSEDGTNDSFEVVLNTEPASNVVIDITGLDATEGSLDKTQLTFTPGNWSTPQTVTVTGVNDDLTDGDITYTLTLSVNDALSDDDYDGLSTTVDVTNTDNDTPGITTTLSGGSNQTSEDGTDDSFDVVLDTEPASNVVIDITGLDATEGSLDKTQLTFTPGNWSTPQTVTVTGANDDLTDGDITYTLTLTVNNALSDDAYDGLSTTVDVTNIDNDTPGVTTTLSGGSNQTSEDGTDDSFDVVLDTEPASDVVIDITGLDATEGSLDKTQLTFTSGNWSTPQTVTVTGANDDLTDGDITYTLTLTVNDALSDDAYDGLSTTVDVTNVDNDTPGITTTLSGGSNQTSEDGTDDSFDVVLDTEPASNVVIDITGLDATEGSLDKTQLTFTPGNWSTPQTVTVTGEDDDLTDGDITYTLTLSVNDALSDNDYDGLSTTVDVINTDNDTPGITTTLSGGSNQTSENGADDSFDVVLDTEPASDVVIDITGLDATEGSLDKTQLTFTAANWSAPQTVTVTGVNDDLTDGDITYILTLSVNDALSDNGYDGLSTTVDVTNTDNDTPGITTTLSGGINQTSEDGTDDSFDVVLDTEPASNVVIDITGLDATEGSPDKTQLTFSAANWLTPQTVTVTGEDDDLTDGDITYTLTLTVNDALSDDAYDGLSTTVDVTNTDNDTPGITTTLSGGSNQTSEDGTDDSFDVVLDTEPTSNVVIDITGLDATEGSLDKTQLTFTPGNWSTPQTVTVTGEDDDLTDGDITYTLTLTVNDALSDDDYDGLSTTVDVTNIDNDEVTEVNHAPVAIDDSATIREGETATGNVLDNDSDPDGDILTVSTTPEELPENGDVVLSPDGTYVYTPDPGFTGTDSFTYRVCDDGTPPACATATVTITVTTNDTDNDGIPDDEEEEGDCDNDGIDNIHDPDACPEAELFVPQGFSPNNDGNNDYFVIQGLEQYDHVSVLIFNRWGNKVYERDDYQNDWDGTSNVNLSIGKELPSGTYFYQVTVHDTNEFLTGYVYLNR